jgi:hypothetical protein
VDAEVRRQGIATAVIDWVARDAQEHGFPGLIHYAYPARREPELYLTFSGLNDRRLTLTNDAAYGPVMSVAAGNLTT